MHVYIYNINQEDNIYKTNLPTIHACECLHYLRKNNKHHVFNLQVRKKKLIIFYEVLINAF